MSSRISPTAHYTAQVWVRHELAPQALGSRTGRVLHRMLEPLDALFTIAGHRTIEQMLIARHGLIDDRLAAAIEGGISQVVELASGYSGRGYRFTHRHDGLTYVDSDLPEVIDRKRTMLRALESTPDHRFVRLDVTASRGNQSVEALLDELDPSRGVAIISEGLLPYLSHDAVLDLWQRLAARMSTYSQAVYLTELHPRDDVAVDGWGPRVFRGILQTFVRGRVRLHFARPADAIAHARSCGFERISVHSPEPAGHRPIVRVLEAWT